MLRAVIGPVPKEKPGIVRPTITDEVIRRNGGRTPKELQVRRARDDYDSDAAESVASVATTSSCATTNSRRNDHDRKPFSVDAWVEDTFKMTTDSSGAARIPKNDVRFVADYLEYSKLEAALEQPVSRNIMMQQNSSSYRSNLTYSKTNNDSLLLRSGAKSS